MKILFCSPIVPTKELGASKVLWELAEGLEAIGWNCKLLNPLQIDPELGHYGGFEYQKRYKKALYHYLKKYAAHYDVIDYDHVYLPYDRQEFSTAPLFVARSVLLIFHLQTIPIPAEGGWLQRVKRRVRQPIERNRLAMHARNATKTLQMADLVNVSNEDDRTTLVKSGIPADQITVIPYGISPSRRVLFDQLNPDAVPENPTIAFVGTFDARKGARDLPLIFQQIAQAIPEAQFQLLGTHRSVETVLSHFKPALRPHITVIPQFSANDLPQLLAHCSVGIFPSYLEGFGFGVLEMLAASIPVIAYDTPGPPMMLSSDYLVQRGDFKAMASKIVQLLQNPTQLVAARQWARTRSQAFCWHQIAQQTSEVYLNFRNRKP